MTRFWMISNDYLLQSIVVRINFYLSKFVKKIKMINFVSIKKIKFYNYEKDTKLLRKKKVERQKNVGKFTNNLEITFFKYLLINFKF